MGDERCPANVGRVVCALFCSGKLWRAVWHPPLCMEVNCVCVSAVLSGPRPTHAPKIDHIGSNATRHNVSRHNDKRPHQIRTNVQPFQKLSIAKSSNNVGVGVTDPRVKYIVCRTDGQTGERLTLRKDN